MATGALRTNFADKRNMPQNRVKDTFFDYLLERLLEVTSRVWEGQRGIFGSTSLVSGGTDRFSVSGPFPVYMIDGDGNILMLDATYGEEVYFENELGVTYYVGARHILIPKGVLRNPRTGVVHYDLDEDMIGERAEPDSITEVAGTLELVVDSVCETGVSNAGRSVTVWMKRPRTTEDAVAIERNLTVVYSGGVNKVVTTGLLGQGSPASTDPADYQVALQGLTVKRNTDLSITDPYAFLGTVTGGGAGAIPSGFSVLGQIDVSDGLHPDLQTAYQAGNVVTPSAAYGGAVKIQSADSGDEVKSLFVLDRKGATETAAQNLVAIAKRGDGAALVSLLPFQELTDLQEDEPGTTAAAGIVNLTRGGVDLDAVGVGGCHDLVKLWDFAPTTGMNRFYRISSHTATQLTLLNLDGTAVAAPWGVGESGNVSILRMRVVFAESGAFGGGMISARAPLTLTGRESLGADDTLLRLVPAGADYVLKALDPTDYEVTRITRHGVIHVQPPDAGSSDPMDALVRLNRWRSSNHGQIGLACEMGLYGRSIPIITLGSVANGVELNQYENVTLTVGTNEIVWSRVGVDLTLEALRIRPDFHLVYVYGTADPTVEGLYVVDVVTGADRLEVRNFDGTNPSFPADAVKARVLLPRFAVADGNTPWAGTVLTGRDAEGNAAPVLVYPEGGTFRVLDNGKAGAVNVPRDLIVVDPSLVNPGNLAHPVKFLRSTLIRGGSVSGAPGEESFYSRDGLRVWNAGGYSEDRNPAFAIAVDYGFPEEIPTYDTWPVFGVDVLGGVARPHHFRDDFIPWLRGTNWTNVYPQPTCYQTFFVGAGYIQPRDVFDGLMYGHGSLYFRTGVLLNDVAQLSLGSLCPCNLDSDKDFRWTFRGRLRSHFVLDNGIRFGFLNATGNERYYFQKDSLGVWSFIFWDGFALVASALTCNATTEFTWFQITLSPSGVSFQVDGKFHGVGTYMNGFESIASLSGNAQAVGPAAWIQTLENDWHSMTLDYWEIFDREVLYARMGTDWNQVHP